MSASRLTTRMRVSALIRLVSAEGGHATVLRKGDEHAGELLLLLTEKGRFCGLFERTIVDKTGYGWRKVTMEDAENAAEIDGAISRRTRVDPDIWVLELDIVKPERFIDETMSFI